MTDDEDAEAVDEDPPADETEEAETEEAETEEAEPEADIDSESFGVSFDSVISAINTLRAGRSLKDSAIKDQTSAYYDRLSDPERKVLLLFLSELSKILSGTVDGSEAKDPSDSPLNITIGDTEEAEEDIETAGEEEDVAGEEELADEGEEGEEDTTPPIRVDEAQDTAALRRKIRRMMLRG